MRLIDKTTVRAFQIYCFFLIFFSQLCVAQENDFEFWTGIQVEKELFKDFSISFEEELRLNENATSISSIFTQLGVSYKIHKYLNVGVAYRFVSVQNRYEYFDTKNRYQVDLGTRKKINKKITLKARTRIQQSFTNALNNEFKEPETSKWAWRNKATFDYRPKKDYTFATSIETYNRLNDSEGNYFQKLRITQALDYRINKKMDLTIFYRFEREFNANLPGQNSIVGLFYKVEI